MNQTEQTGQEIASPLPQNNDGRIVVDHHLVPAMVRQQAIVAIGRRAVAPPDLSVLICDAAALAAESLQLRYFSAAELNPGGNSLALAFGRIDCPDDKRIPPKSNLTRDPEKSLSGYALGVARPVVTPDLSKFFPCKDAFLKKQGAVGAIVCPLIYLETLYGTIGVYSTEVREFTNEEVSFVESISHIVTSSVARERAEQQLKSNQDFTRVVHDTMESLLLELTTDGRIVRFNRACQETTGFEEDEVKDRPVWGAFLVPEDVPFVQKMFEQLRREKGLVKFECSILHKHGGRRRVAWSFALEDTQEGQGQSMVGTGVDITVQFEAVERAERAEQDVKEVKEILVDLRKQIESGKFSDGITHSMSESTEKERRELCRKPYPYVQLLAPMRGDSLPLREEFSKMHCHDISSRGFSFMSPEAPTYERIVIAFGSAPNLLYVIAQVRHVTKTTFNNRTMHLVGCAYESRAPYIT